MPAVHKIVTEFDWDTVRRLCDSAQTPLGGSLMSVRDRPGGIRLHAASVAPTMARQISTSEVGSQIQSNRQPAPNAYALTQARRRRLSSSGVHNAQEPAVFIAIARKSL
jgi:hypothetical protein